MGRHKKKDKDSDGTNRKLKVITVNIAVDHHNLLKELVRLGRYSSVSEAVRNMADDWLTWKIDSAKEISKLPSEPRFREIDEFLIKEMLAWIN